jgi:type 1 fimbria pilin
VKKHLIALSIGLTAAFTGTSAFANTGTINFEGKITASTCPIEVINPGDGSTGSLVKMGSLEATRFSGVGQEYNGKQFALRVVDPSKCALPVDAVAKVAFNGTADASGDYFAVGTTTDSAKGVAIVIKDKTGTALKPGEESAEYDLHATNPTDMTFNAYYRSTAATVTAGAASADIQFVVAIN